ncbi:sorting nexin-1a isoform X2 [Hemibagrus wyckioides]|uniref:sorting nexin-1a isoform X2 n=1 Tax=Hemibagrus wyckioides TaxID=337641 RepID=UPI00266C0F92|nr:sorting nexin-1a isoform X2 [Hemibagrus wyckioides]
MAAGSKRSPPPFPDSEEQDPEPELGEDEDSDEGADIFTGSVLSHTPVDPLVHVSTPKDVFSEALEDPLNDRGKANTEPEKSASDTKGVEVDLFADPLGESGAQAVPDKNSAPLSNVSEAPPKSSIPKSEASSEVFGASQNDVKKSADIFEEPPKDEPLQASVKKPKGKESIKGRNDQSKNATTDLFTEEVTRVPPPAAAKPSTDSSSKTNGLHSDEDDLFTEATVELSLDSPHNDHRKRETPKASAPASSLSASASASKPQPKTLEELEEEEKEDKFDLNISVTNPEKVGDGMNAYMAYRVSTQTTLSMFRSKQFTVRRRFSDFLGLYEKLSEKHSQNGHIVPPPPEKSILGMTKVKVGKEDPSSAEFVERRRAALERYLQRLVSHPSLLQDPDVREFLEKEELPRAVSTQALSGAGFLKMINKATDAVSKMTIKMNESDVWFEDKLQEVENEDQQLRKLHAMVESLVNHRKELSMNTAVFAKSVAMLGSSEDNTALSRALSQLAEVEDRIEQLHQDQASNDFFIFAELLADYIRLLGAVRACFDQRMKAWQRWQDAENMLQKKRETEAKLLWANKPDKLQQAKDEITEWESKVSQYERDFERVSATVRKEVLRFEKEKARDFKKQIVRYLESLLNSQQQLIKYWEAFLPEAKAIA